MPNPASLISSKHIFHPTLELLEDRNAPGFLLQSGATNLLGLECFSTRSHHQQIKGRSSRQAITSPDRAVVSPVLGKLAKLKLTNATLLDKLQPAQSTSASLLSLIENHQDKNKMNNTGAKSEEREIGQSSIFQSPQSQAAFASSTLFNQFSALFGQLQAGSDLPNSKLDNAGNKSKPGGTGGSSGSGGNSPRSIIVNEDGLPYATDDFYSIGMNQTLNGNSVSITPGVLENDDWGSVPVTPTITASTVDAPKNGTLVFNADGTFAYTPAANFQGTDYFTYQAYNGTNYSNIATAVITVTPNISSIITIGNDSYTTYAGEQLDVAAPGVIQNDSHSQGGSLKARIVTTPQNGSITQFNDDGSFSYVPAEGFSGTDYFTYAVSDGVLNSTIGTVTLTMSDKTVVAISTPNPSISEDSLDNTKYVISRTGDALDPMTVSISVSGTAAEGIDYIALPDSITIPAGSKSVTLEIQPINDGEDEPSEYLIVSIGNSQQYHTGNASSARVDLINTSSVIIDTLTTSTSNLSYIGIKGDYAVGAIGLTSTTPPGVATLDMSYQVPSGSVIKRAYLYWTTYGYNAIPSSNIKINGVNVSPNTSSLFSYNIPWGTNTDVVRCNAYKTDITSFASASLTFTFSGYENYNANYTIRKATNAYVAIVYEHPAENYRDVMINDVMKFLLHPAITSASTTFTGYKADYPVSAKTTYIASGDKFQHSTFNSLYISPENSYIDSIPINVSAYVQSGSSTSTASITNTGLSDVFRSDIPYLAHALSVQRNITFLPPQPPPNQAPDVVPDDSPCFDVFDMVGASPSWVNLPTGFSEGPVRYYDGVAKVAITDLSSNGLGDPTSLSRTWTNGVGYSDGQFGNGWSSSEQPKLIRSSPNSNATLAILSNGTNARYFDLAASNSYRERNGGSHTFNFSPTQDLFVLVNADGSALQFYGFQNSYLFTAPSPLVLQVWYQ